MKNEENIRRAVEKTSSEINFGPSTQCCSPKGSSLENLKNKVNLLKSVTGEMLVYIYGRRWCWCRYNKRLQLKTRSKPYCHCCWSCYSSKQNSSKDHQIEVLYNIKSLVNEYGGKRRVVTGRDETYCLNGLGKMKAVHTVFWKISFNLYKM